MPWSFALPRDFFTSPVLAVATPIGVGSLVGYLVNITSSQTLYTTQLVLNYLWMPLFFGVRKPGWALADIVALGATVGKLMATWWDIDRTAFWMMLPYAGWLCFATYLNVGVGWLNNWDFESRDGR
ncbi:hypothetical protein CNMCM7691_000658 [Aspergillus felis]|uniref:Benzodiazepine receptor family protein n=1 Tax=Aspergillus felis TaxID=1287682 RepID=A0A8H6QXK3_9EURO|nr:hypothetical protein CNMCM7691_000658 [Aspergillus felis]